MHTVTDSSGIGSSLQELTGVPTIRGTIPCSGDWFESMTADVRRRTELLLEPTHDYDVIFVVGQDRAHVYANSVILKANSELFRKVLRNKDGKGQVHMPDITDSYAFGTFISLLTPASGKTEDIKGILSNIHIFTLFSHFNHSKISIEIL